VWTTGHRLPITGAGHETGGSRRHGPQASPRDAGALAEMMETLFSHGAMADRMGRNARAKFLSAYTPQRNFEALFVYTRVLQPRRSM